MPSITLLTSDGQDLIVETDVLRQSETLGNLIDILDDTDEVLPLPNIDADIMNSVLVYLEHHVNDPPLPLNKRNYEITNAWDANFINVDTGKLFRILEAANYLAIRSLFELGTKEVANRLKGKTSEEMRVILGLTNNFTPEQAEQVRKETAWLKD